MISREAWYREAQRRQRRERRAAPLIFEDAYTTEEVDRADGVHKEPLDKSVTHFDHERLKRRAQELLAQFDKALRGLKDGVIITHLEFDDLLSDPYCPRELLSLLHFLKTEYREAVWPVRKKISKHRFENLTEDDIQRLEQAYEDFTTPQEEQLALDNDWASYQDILNWYYETLYTKDYIEGSPPAMLLDVMKVLRLNKLKLEKAVSESHELGFPARRFLQDMAPLWDEGIRMGEAMEAVPYLPGQGEHFDAVEPYRERVENLRERARSLLSRIHETFPEIHLL